jgi:hypothetical protein
LKGVVVDKRLLQRMKCLPCGKLFNRRHFRIVLHDHQRQTRIDALAIHQQGTSTVLAVVAAFFFVPVKSRYSRSVSSKVIHSAISNSFFRAVAGERNRTFHRQRSRNFSHGLIF